MKLHVSEIIDEAIDADVFDDVFMSDEKLFVATFFHENEMHHTYPGQP